MPETAFEKLNEQNYADWRYMMEALLIEKDLWGVVDGSESRPAGSPNLKPVRAFIKKQQVARAKIILHIEPSQLPHARLEDPKDIWANLEQVHRAQGFATRLALRRQFLYMHKDEAQVMSSWISDVKNAAFHLESAGVAIIDEDVILALTVGLPESYSSFIVALDNLPIKELTLPNVITRLLNEEVRQNRTSFSYDEGQAFGAVATKNKKSKTPINRITCYNCGGKGHYKTDCPSSKEVEKALSAFELGPAGDDEDNKILF